MNDIGVYTPEQARLVWQDYLRRQTLTPQISQNYPQRRPIDEVSPHRVFVKNTSAEVIPPYACLRVTGTVVIDGRSALLVEKPSSVSGEFVFNGPYEIPALADVGVGWAYRYEIVVMLGTSTAPTAANVRYKPVVSSFAIVEGAGPFVVFGTHNAATNAVIGRISGGAGDTAYALIASSDEDDEFQSVTLYRKAIPATFTTTSCGSTDFDDMEFTLSESMGTETVLVPAGYKAGEALLIKMEIGVTGHAWTGWVVFTGPTWRCATRIPTEVECCPTTQLIQFTEYQNFWFFGKVTGTTADPCP